MARVKLWGGTGVQTERKFFRKDNLLNKLTNLESCDCQILGESFFTSERSHVTRDCDIHKVFCDHLYVL